MRRFVEGTDRGQSTLFPECLEDWIAPFLYCQFFDQVDVPLLAVRNEYAEQAALWREKYFAIGARPP